MKHWLTRLNQYLSHALETYTPGLSFPLTIVCLNSIGHIFNTQYIYGHIELSEIPRNIQIAISILGGFFIFGGSLISWLLISVIVFYWCELFYDIEGSFRNFFEIVGICHFVLLIGTLICYLFMFFGLSDDLAMLENRSDAQEQSEVINEVLSPLKFIGTISNICFGLVLVVVIQVLFYIKWLRAFCGVGIPYTVYWLLSRALQSVFQFN